MKTSPLLYTVGSVILVTLLSTCSITELPFPNKQKSVENYAEITLWPGDKISAFSPTVDVQESDDISSWINAGDKFGFKLSLFVNAVSMQEDAGQLAQLYKIQENGHDINALITEQDDSKGNYVLSKQLLKAHQIKGKHIASYHHNSILSISSKLAGTSNALRKIGGGVNTVNQLNSQNISAVSLTNESQLDQICKNNWAGIPSLFSGGKNEGGWYVARFIRTNKLSNMVFNLLSQNKHQIWVAPFSDVKTYLGTRINTKVAKSPHIIDASNMVYQVDTRRIQDKESALTIRIPLKENWYSWNTIVYQNDREVPIRFIEKEDIRYVLVDILPSKGHITLRNI